jgi:hypothetical protein
MAGVRKGKKVSRGRPTSLTPEVQEKICDTIRSGNFRDVAAQSAGISVRALREWVSKGKKAKYGIHREFLHAVLVAESEAEIVCVNRVIEASKEDAKHAEWWLERKFPERWSTHKQELNRLRKELHILLSTLGKERVG